MDDPTELPGPLIDALRTAAIIFGDEGFTHDELESAAEHRSLDLIPLAPPEEEQLDELVERGLLAEDDGTYRCSERFQETEFYRETSSVEPEYRETVLEVPVEGGEMTVSGNHGLSELEDRSVEDGTLTLYRDEDDELHLALRLETHTFRLHGDVDTHVPALDEYLDDEATDA